MTVEELFAFAAKYWYVVVVLIGFAASMFSKRMQPQRGTGRPLGDPGSEARRMSEGGGGWAAEGRRGRAGEPGMPSFGGGMGSPVRSPRRVDAPAAEQRRGLEAPAADAWPAKQVAAPPVGAPAVSAAAAAEQRRGPDAHALAQGVLWAEILGPPRAKKPRIR